MTPSGGARGWSAAELREHLQALSDRVFTQLIADLWHRQGWTVDVANRSSKIDIRATMATPYHKRALIQTVQATAGHPLGVSAIEELASLKRHEPTTGEAIIVTSGTVTDATAERARACNVTLIDGEELLALIETVSGYDIVDHYVEKSSGSDTSDSEEVSTPEADLSSHRNLSTGSRLGPTPTVDREHDSWQDATEHTAQQALERATTTVELTPSDAAELGVFDGIQCHVVTDFADSKRELAFMRNDLYLTQDNVLFVADLTEYAPRAAIAGQPEGRVAGMIRPEVPDDAWLANNGEAALHVQSIVTRIHEEIERTLVRNTVAEENVDVSRSSWLYIIVGGVVAWLSVGGLLYAPISVSTGWLTAIVATAWIGLPLGLCADASRTGIFIAYPKRTLLVVLASLVPWVSIVAGVVYLHHRKTLI